MIKKRTIIEESNILKEIKRNITREKEVIQALCQAWFTLGWKSAE